MPNENTLQVYTHLGAAVAGSARRWWWKRGWTWESREGGETWGGKREGITGDRGARAWGERESIDVVAHTRGRTAISSAKICVEVFFKSYP
jgi:hypothetical protein